MQEIIIIQARRVRSCFGDLGREATKWLLFFNGLFTCDKKCGVVLFHVENWHFGWHLGSVRHLTYREIIGRRKTLFIDLNSQIMVWIASFKLGQTGAKYSECVDVEILKRHLWDQDLRSLSSDLKAIKYKQFTKSLNNCEDYLALYHDISTELSNSFQKKIRAVSILARSDFVDGIAVVQDAYTDQCFKIVAKMAGKKNYLPEHLYGFYVGYDLSPSLDKKIYDKFRGKITHDDLVVARSYLENRICGKYSESTLSSYMSDLEVASSAALKPEFIGKKNIIFFLHAFTDAPNANVASSEDMSFIDHYHFFLSFHETFKDDRDVDVYIKPHPSNERYPGDGMFFKRVLEVCEYSSNFSLMSSKLTVGSLFDQDINDSLYCLSGYGSVTLECAYLGLPIFNYKRCIYTELGLSNFIEKPQEILSFFKNSKPTSQVVNGRDLAISIEAFRIVASRRHIFSGTSLSEKKSRLLDLVATS